MKHLKTYQLFESRTGLTADQEAFLNKYTKGTWTLNPATGLVDVKGGFRCSAEGLEDFVGVKFGKVSGGFYCDRNYLTSLEGAPQEVGGDFNCRSNELTSLAGAPQKVVGDFECDNNDLRSLTGAPQEVGEGFYCSGNYLTSLEGAPQEVGGKFDCSSNNLTSLEGAPQEVGVDFKCDAFELEKGEWNPKGWLKVLQEGSPEAQKLISIIFSAEELNKEIAKDPAGMIMKLKGVWNDENFKETRSKLVWPKGYEGEADLVGGLNSIGF